MTLLKTIVDAVLKLIPKQETPTMRNLLVYYGWVNSFNSAQNQWTNEKVAQDMARYGLIVLGSGVANPTHGDYANTAVIIPRIKALNPQALIFGYVTANQDLATFESQVSDWNALGVHGIFMDESGYDFGKNREEFNDRVDYVHSRSHAKFCFVNAWNPDHVLGTANDVNFPNTTFNPQALKSNLKVGDWLLLENFGILNSTYEPASQWHARGTKAKYLTVQHGLELAAVSVISNADAAAQAKFNFGYTSASMWSCDAYGSSDDFYGAGSASVTLWNRPDVFNMGLEAFVKSATPAVVNDGTTYFRYLPRGVLKLSFATGSELATITKI